MSISNIRTWVILAIMAFSGNAGFAQSAYKVGSKIKIEITTYPSAFELSSKFKKGNVKAKQKEATRLKEDIASGKIEPSKVYTIEYTVASMDVVDGKTQMVMKMADASGSYKSIVDFGKDTVYIHRCEATTPMKIKEDTVGFYYAGTEVLPTRLNVGDRTMGYCDLMAMFPVENKDQVKMVFNVHNQNYGYRGYVTQKFTGTATTSMLTINQSGTVKQNAKLNIGGKDVNTWLIGAEVWVKNTTSIDFQLEQQNYFADPGVNSMVLDKNKKYFDDAGNGIQETIDEISGANEQGYVVKYKEEWYSPDYGMAVLTKNYDNWGLLQSVIKLVSVD